MDQHPVSKLCVCICTYRREQLLLTLLRDLTQQRSLPEHVVIVDGDPRNGKVLNALKEIASVCSFELHYLPSNHGNLAYQRYLGWRAAREERIGLLLYLDDDLRITDPESISRLLQPLRDGRPSVVGCTGDIQFPEDREGDADPAVQDRVHFNKSKTPLIVKLFGAARRMPPGGLSPSGQRSLPAISSSGTADVQWLRGGVMACKMDSLTEDCFSDDLFALSELGFGHGEDTLLSRRLASKGKLVFVSDAPFLHPCADTPKAYATRAREMGYGAAYSRRLLNDNYRWPKHPTASDRFVLLKSSAGTSLLCLLRALGNPRSHRFAYARGYFVGALQGIFMPPRHKRLTPRIDWQKDAAAATSLRVTLSSKS